MIGLASSISGFFIFILLFSSLVVDIFHGDGEVDGKERKGTNN